MPAMLIGFITDVPNVVVVDALAQTSIKIQHAQSKVNKTCCRKMSRFSMTCREMSRILMSFYDALIAEKKHNLLRNCLAKCRNFFMANALSQFARGLAL